MATGWRLSIGDLPILVERGDGVVAFDLLSRSAVIDGQPVALTIMTEIGPWLDEAMTRDDLPGDLITQFTMRLDFHITEERADGRDVRRLEMHCESHLVTAGSEFAGSHDKCELWTRTTAAEPWLVRDV